MKTLLSQALSDYREQPTAVDHTEETKGVITSIGEHYSDKTKHTVTIGTGQGRNTSGLYASGYNGSKTMDVPKTVGAKLAVGQKVTMTHSICADGDEQYA